MKLLFIIFIIIWYFLGIIGSYKFHYHFEKDKPNGFLQYARIYFFALYGPMPFMDSLKGGWLYDQVPNK